MPQKDKLEILNILGVLNSMDARVSLPVFSQKVVEFLERPSEEETNSAESDIENIENVDVYESFMSSYSQAQPQVLTRRNTFSSIDESINVRMSPFKPSINSSFLICESAGCSPPDTPSLSRLSFMEDTFEGDGEEKTINEPDEFELNGNYSRK